MNTEQKEQIGALLDSADEWIKTSHNFIASIIGDKVVRVEKTYALILFDEDEEYKETEIYAVAVFDGRVCVLPKREGLTLLTDEDLLEDEGWRSVVGGNVVSDSATYSILYHLSDKEKR